MQHPLGGQQSPFIDAQFTMFHDNCYHPFVELKKSLLTATQQCVVIVIEKTDRKSGLNLVYHWKYIL